MSAGATGHPVAAGLFEWPSDTARLLAGRCRDCDTVVFPQPEACPRCSGRSIETEPVEGRGRLWTWTIQRFRPKEPYDGPEEFEPYGVGYVDFDGRVLIEGRLTGAPDGRYAIGQEMEICLVPYATDHTGNVLTFAFRPASEGGGR